MISPPVRDAIYSFLSAVTGSSRDARHAGMYPAATAQMPRTSVSAQNVTASS